MKWALLLALVACSSATTGTGPEKPIEPALPDAAPPAPPAPGTVTGHAWEGAFVWLDGVPATQSLDAEITFRDGSLQPEAVLLAGEGSLTVSSLDAVRHELTLGQARVPLPLEGQRFTLRPPGPGVHPLGCLEHPSEKGWALVASGPAARAGADGTFRFEGVPAGTRTLVVWSGAAEVRKAVEVAPGAVTDVTLTR
jgi:hypothetical protein